MNCFLNCFIDIWMSFVKQNIFHCSKFTIMKNLIFYLLAITLFSCSKSQNIRVQSPDGNIHVQFGINNSSAIYYSVETTGDVIIQNSQMGFQFEGAPNFRENLEILSFTEMEVNQTWNPVYGERSVISDKYNEIKVLQYC